jgi:hypothetical protein
MTGMALNRGIGRVPPYETTISPVGHALLENLSSSDESPACTACPTKLALSKAPLGLEPSKDCRKGRSWTSYKSLPTRIREEHC